MKFLVYTVLTLMTVALSFQASHGAPHPVAFREEPLEKFQPDLKTGIEAVLEGNYQTAKKHLAPFAKQGHYGAQFLIADLAFHGKIKGYGYEEIKELYKASAEQGYPRAQIKYATILFIERDFFMAYVWSHIAHKNGHKKALGIRDEQASMLSKQQVYHAKRHAIACKYSNYQEC